MRTTSRRSLVAAALASLAVPPIPGHGALRTGWSATCYIDVN
ncbi:MAG TPA: hypothetical protein VNQ77_07895 [Frankiaceae bacterium]|nr:hypothetical protein [Frankiaceae bacterium]